MIRIFIGFDSKEIVAYHVLSQSINSFSSRPVSITPLIIGQLNDVFTRRREPLQSTEFSISRFLVPYLCNYEGWSIFMDCDMLVLDDINKLWALRDENYSVMVVKHDYTPKTSKKALGLTQTKYDKKNWSSMMLINNAKCKALTPEYVNTASALDLHQFKWLEDDSQIGELEQTWNFLVGEYEKGVTPAIAHYTIAGPYFREFRDIDYSPEWFIELRKMLDCNGDCVIPQL